MAQKKVCVFVCAISTQISPSFLLRSRGWSRPVAGALYLSLYLSLYLRPPPPCRCPPFSSCWPLRLFDPTCRSPRKVAPRPVFAARANDMGEEGYPAGGFHIGGLIWRWAKPNWVRLCVCVYLPRPLPDPSPPLPCSVRWSIFGMS